MSDRVILPAKKVGETVLYPQFDFLSLFASSTDSISSAIAHASVYSGVDSNPNVIISSSSISGSIVNVLVTQGILGVIYELSVAATLSSGQIIILAGYLAIIPDLQ